MTNKEYKKNVWYDVVDEAYWAEEYPDEFPNCFSIICETNSYGKQNIYTRSNCNIGWGTMAKRDNYKFMIIEKPELSHKSYENVD